MDLMDLVAGRVKVLYSGTWEESQVEIEKNNKYRPQITRKMREVARARFAARKKKNPKLFNGNTLHLALGSSIIQPNHILLTMGPIKYSIYDIARKEYAEKYGWKDLPTGIGDCAVVLTSDSKIVMHHRFPHVDHLGEIAVIGGVYQSGSPFDAIKEELREELRVTKRAIKKIRLIGVSNRLEKRINYELSFLVEVSLSSKQIIKKEKMLQNREGKIFFLSCSPEEIREYLKDNHEKIASTHFAALVMAGHYLWGPAWSQI